MLKFILGLCTCCTLFVGPTLAQSISAHSPATVVNALKTSGLPAELSRDDAGNPIIQAILDGARFSVSFYDCTNGAQCQDLQLRAAFQLDGVSEDQIRAWNQNAFVGKAFVLAPNTAILEHPMIGVDGMSRFTFQRTLLRWKVALDAFKADINWTQ